MAMLEVLAVAAGHEIPPSNLLEPVSLPYGSTLILITRRLAVDVTERLQVLRRRGWRPVVVLIEGDKPELPGIKVWEVADSSSLAEVGL
jgi:vacuolar-type H+-ATPase subunit F/Vma7